MEPVLPDFLSEPWSGLEKSAVSMNRLEAFRRLLRCFRVFDPC